MKTYRITNILVPTDFSAIAQNALSHAARIADLTGARITLLNVVEPASKAYGTSGMLGLSSILEEKLRVVSMKKCQRIAHSLTKRSHVRVNPQAIIARVASGIRNEAAKTKADLIVMGTHGTTGFVQNLLGSNTYRVSSLSSIPVLSVHKRMHRRGYRHIIYPVREERHALDKFSHAVKFARLFNATVHIIGLITPDLAGQERHMRDRCAEIEGRFAKLKIHAESAFSSRGFFPEEAIRFGHSHQDSLVVITQDSDFHLVEVFQGAFSKRVLQKVLSPVIAVPGR